jgi:NAD(P)-dependent dehydrogenase (short-subunit alcohol dehydrogenase family)
VIVARTADKGEAVRKEIMIQSGNDAVAVLRADLSSQESIRQLAQQFKAKYQRLHVFINNAGAIYAERTLSVDGLEMTFALDHLGYFLLTNVLLDVLKASAPARIIVISSGAERFGTIRFDDLQGEKKYNAIASYAQAKLANVLFTYELARRLEGTRVTVNAVRPGPMATNFAKDTRGFLRLAFSLLFAFAPGAEKGAETAVYLASSPDVAGVTGKFFYHKKETTSSRKSHDVALQQQLWEVCAELTKLPAKM